MKKTSIIAGKSSEELAKKLARKIKANLIKTEVRVFPDGESKITLFGNVSKRRTVVVHSIYPPVDNNLVQALSLIAKAKELSSEVIAVIPYMGYARQDREFLPGEIVTMKVLGKLFKSSGASRIIVVDIHSIMGLKYFTRNSQNVSAIPDLVKHFRKMRLKNPLVVSPDRGGEKRAKEFAKELNSDYIALDKKRDRKTGKVEIKTKDLDLVKARDVILVDDMISTGGSIIKATKFLKKQKSNKVYVACTHALLINDAKKKIKQAGVTKIISANTIPGDTSTVDVSSAIAKAIA